MGILGQSDAVAVFLALLLTHDLGVIFGSATPILLSAKRHAGPLSLQRDPCPPPGDSGT
jgi:hypothetical protein